MANRLNGFLDNIFNGATNPKGTLGDYQHANRLYISDSFRLAPKQKFLYHVCFNINPAIDGVANFTQKHGREINMLVKNVKLPGFEINTTVVPQYNRKKQIQTRLDYDPVRITLHDDNFGLTTLLWQAYYRYYYADGNHATPDATGKINESNGAYSYKNAYGSNDANKFRYGLDNGSDEPFFTSIQIFQLARHQYQAFTLVNPIVGSWSHDTMDQSEGQGIVESQMDIEYETVWYSSGQVEEDVAPKGFASSHYDHTPSPLTIEGGGTSSLFGQGGVATGLSGVFASLGDPATYKDPKKFLGTLLRAGNVYQNAKDLTAEGLRGEGLQILREGLGQVQRGEFGGLGNIVFPKGASTVGEGLLDTATKAVKAVAPALLVAKLAENPALGDSVAKTFHALTSSSPSSGLEDYESLNISRKAAVKNDMNNAILAGEPKITTVASRAVGNYEADIT